MLISNFDPASAKTVQECITAVGAMPTIEPGSPWVNGYIDSFNARRSAKRRDPSTRGSDSRRELPAQS